MYKRGDVGGLPRLADRVRCGLGRVSESRKLVICGHTAGSTAEEGRRGGEICRLVMLSDHDDESEEKNFFLGTENERVRPLVGPR